MSAQCQMGKLLLIVSLLLSSGTTRGSGAPSRFRLTSLNPRAEPEFRVTAPSGDTTSEATNPEPGVEALGLIDRPAVGEGSTTPPDQGNDSVPKKTESPAEQIDLEPAQPASQPVLPDNSMNLISGQIYTPGELPRTDPIARAASNRALTRAESMLDGLGGIPVLPSPVFESSRATSLRKRFRIGPLNFTGPTITGGASFGSYDRSEATAGGAGRGEIAPQSSGGNGNGQDGFQATGGFSLGMILGEPATGHRLLVNYGASYRTEDSSSSGNTTGGSKQQPLNQSLSILGQLDFTKLTLGMGVSFDSLSGTNRDVGGAANRQLLTVSLNSSYQWTPKTSLDWDLSLPVRQVSGGIGSAGFTSTNFVNHRFSKKLELGLGFVAGIDEVGTTGAQPLSDSGFSGGASTQKFEQINARFSLAPSPRISLSGTLGVEFRDSGGTNSINPLFSLVAVWSPREGTSFSLSGDQTVNSSASLIGQNFVSTGVSVSVSQRLGRRMNLNLSLGYEHAVYESTGANEISNQAGNPGRNRVDDLITAQVGLSLNLKQGWSASISYLYSENRSTTDGFASSRGQIQLGYTF